MTSERIPTYTDVAVKKHALQLADNGAIQLPSAFFPTLASMSLIANASTDSKKCFEYFTRTAAYPIIDAILRCANSSDIKSINSELIIREDNSEGNKDWHQDNFDQIMSIVLPFSVGTEAELAIGGRSNCFDGKQKFSLPYLAGPILLAQKGFGSAIPMFEGSQECTWHKPLEEKPRGIILALDLFI